jgi:hypothetical protein
MNVMQREVSDLGGDDEGNVKIVMGDYFIDNFGQQFILVSNKNKFYYADLKHTADRVILAEVLTTEKTVSSVTVHRTNGSLFVAYKNGEVETYKFLHPKSSVLKPKLKLVDSWNLTENPHEKEVQSNSNVNFYKYIVNPSHPKIFIIHSQNRNMKYQLSIKRTNPSTSARRKPCSTYLSGIS